MLPHIEREIGTTKHAAPQNSRRIAARQRALKALSGEARGPSKCQHPDAFSDSANFLEETGLASRER